MLAQIHRLTLLRRVDPGGGLDDGLGLHPNQGASWGSRNNARDSPVRGDLDQLQPSPPANDLDNLDWVWDAQ